MFIEIKGKPKEVIIQKLTKKNNWVDVASYRDFDGIDYDKARDLLEFKQLTNNNHFRLILRGKKSKRELQVLSTRAFDFYDVLSDMRTDKGIHLMCDGLKMFANNENPHCIKIDKLADWVRKVGGIKKAYYRPQSPEDGDLATYDITFNDGTTATFSHFHS